MLRPNYNYRDGWGWGYPKPSQTMGNCFSECRRCFFEEEEERETLKSYGTVTLVPQDISGAPTGWKGYHGEISNEEAESRLKIGASNGIFLVYDDPVHQGQYLLAVYYNRSVHRIRIIRRSDGKYVLGEDVPGARAHRSVHGLIKHHRRPFGKPINLEGGGHVVLEGYVYLPS